MDQAETRIEAARPEDEDAVVGLLSAAELPTSEIAGHLPSFLVARAGGEVVGCAGLEIYGHTGVLRSLSVSPTARGCGLGIRLGRAIIERAHQHGLREVVLLTEHADRFFADHLGFEPVTREAVTPAVRASWQFTGAACQSAACMRLVL